MRGQGITASSLGTQNSAGLFEAQGQLKSRERAAIGLSKAGGKSSICGGRATSSKAAAGRVATDPFLAAAHGAQPPPGAGSAAAGAGAVPGSEGGRGQCSLLGFSAPEAAQTFEDCRPLPCRIWAGGSIGGVQVPPPARFAPNRPPPPPPIKRPGALRGAAGTESWELTRA